MYHIEGDETLVCAEWLTFVQSGAVFRQDYQRKMAEAEVKKSLDWIAEQQRQLADTPFGTTKQGVEIANKQQREQDRAVADYKKQVDKLMTKYKLSDTDAKDVNGAYDALQALCAKRSSCIEVMAGIASLEDQIQALTTEIDARVVHLVNSGGDHKPTGSPHQSNEVMAKAALDCISGVRKNWKWITQVMQCAQAHLQNAAAYHEYFHEVEEAEHWMDTTLSRLHLTFDRTKLNGDRTDVQCIQEEMKDTLQAYLQWQTRVDHLFDKGKNVVPVPSRRKQIEYPRPVLALADYKTDEIEFIEGETLTVTDNSDKDKWLVKNERGQSSRVPSVLLLMPSPSSEAMDAAVRLRLQLLALWTASVKRLGYQMIAFMLLVFRDWTEDEIKTLQAMQPKDKEDLLRITQNIEDTLIKNWNGYGDFDDLQEKILSLRMILEEATTPAGTLSKDNEMVSTVVVQIKMLEDMLTNYKDFFAYWETFKSIAEMLKQPKFLLVCDKWEQLRYVTSAHFVRFWDTTLNLEDLSDPESTLAMIKDSASGSSLANGSADKLIEKQDSTVTLHETPKSSMGMGIRSDVTVEIEEEETITDEVTSSVAEEQHTFVITGVIDPNNKHRRFTIQEAIMKGIVDQASGTYLINRKTSETISIPEAINQGKIVVEFQSRKKIKEEKKSIGLITIKTTHETRPYTIKGVVDPHTDDPMGVEEAVDKGILDVNNGTFKTETGDKMPIADAIASGLVKVEFQQGAQRVKPEIVSKTYAVNGVVDQKKKDKVPFKEAITMGLLDKDSGVYINNVTGERIGVSEAIMRGFIKARVVTDPSKLDIDPENKIVVERLAHVRSKIMRAVKVANAFKAAGQRHNSSGGD